MRVDKKIHFIGKCHSCEYKFRINDSDYQDSVEIDIFGRQFFRCPNCNGIAEIHEEGKSCVKVIY